MVRSILKYSEKAENYATIKTKIKPNSPLLFIRRAKTHRFWVGLIVRPNLGLTRLTKTDSEPIGIITPTRPRNLGRSDSPAQAQNHPPDQTN